MENEIYNITDEELAAFLDGNVDENEAGKIISSVAHNSEVAEILSLSPRIDKVVEAENLRIIPILALAAANPQNLCSLDCETYILNQLQLSIDHWTLLETAKANNWLRKDGTPLHHVGRLLELKGLHVERKYDATISDISNSVAEGKYIIAIIDNSILDKILQSKSRYHAIIISAIDDQSISYLDLESSVEENIAIDLFLSAWRISENYMITATSEPSDYNPQPIDVGDINLDADLEELTEAIAENAHDIWARARMDEGWTYGPVRDDDKKQHPDLVPYTKLSESEKGYDRIMAMNTLRLVRRLGFDITNRN